MLPGVQQVVYGQQIETPDGPGYVNMFRVYEDGVICYGVFFQVSHPRWGDSQGYTVQQLRPLNPGIHFPETRHEVWRPAHGVVRRVRFA